MGFDLVSTLVGFLVGTATGAAGTYFGYKFTDRRREKESARRAKKEFMGVKAQMPDLIMEMKDDLAREDAKLTREFFVLPSPRCCIGGSEKPRFAYYASEHENLGGKLAILENRRYLIDVTPKNTPIYRMTEEFVELIRKYG